MLIAPVSHSTSAGGAERWMNLLFPRMVDRGDQVHLLGQIPGWVLPQTAIPFTPKWSRRTTLKGLPRLPAERCAVAAAADRLHPDVFHAQFKREQIGLSDILGRRAPVIWTEHGRFPAGRGSKPLRIGYQRASKHISDLVCVSQAVADEMAGIVGRHVRIEVVPNAIDTTRIRPTPPEQRAAARERLGVPADARVVAWVGRMEAAKLPLLAARAGALIDGVTLLAGGGALWEEVASAVAQTNVRALGPLREPSIVYEAADVFLFTSTGEGEGLPFSLLEASARDLPIVVNESSGMAGELNGAAVTVADDDPRTLAAALESAKPSGGSSRAWAVAHDLEPWTERLAAIFAAALR